MSLIQSPHCCACLRRWLYHLGPRPVHQQVRGRKKLAKPAAPVNVKLLEDIPRYGPRGAIIPVAAGRMRNIWYPQRMADYVTPIQLREMNMRHASFERDSSFGVAKDVDDGQTDEESGIVPVDLDLLSPQRSTELLETYLAPKITFFRTPIPQASPAQAAARNTRASSSAAADLSAASEPVPEPEPVSIYGSVSTADVATSVNALLANHEECLRLNVTADDIIFEDGDEDGSIEADRVKRLGEFQAKIQLRGAQAAVLRTIVVQAERRRRTV